MKALGGLAVAESDILASLPVHIEVSLRSTSHRSDSADSVD